MSHLREIMQCLGARGAWAASGSSATAALRDDYDRHLPACSAVKRRASATGPCWPATTPGN